MANLENIVMNPGLRHIRDRIFGYVSRETLEICREVSEDCNSWLKRFCVVKLMLEFGDEKRSILNLVRSPAMVPGWKKGVTKFAQKASLDDLLDWKLEVKEFLNWCNTVANPGNPVDFAARYDKPRMMQLFLYTDFDNQSHYWPSKYSEPPFTFACLYGSVEIVKMMINSSNEFGIDLKVRDKSGQTALDYLEDKVSSHGDPKKRKIYNELITLLLDKLMDQF